MNENLTQIIDDQNRIMSLFETIPKLNEAMKAATEAMNIKEGSGDIIWSERLALLDKEHEATQEFLKSVNELSLLTEAAQYKFDRLVLEDMANRQEGKESNLDPMYMMTIKMGFDFIKDYDTKLRSGESNQQELNEILIGFKQMSKYLGKVN